MSSNIRCPLAWRVLSAAGVLGLLMLLIALATHHLVYVRIGPQLAEDVGYGIVDTFRLND